MQLLPLFCPCMPRWWHALHCRLLNGSSCRRAAPAWEHRCSRCCSVLCQGGGSQTAQHAMSVLLHRLQGLARLSDQSGALRSGSWLMDAPTDATWRNSSRNRYCLNHRTCRTCLSAVVPRWYAPAPPDSTGTLSALQSPAYIPARRMLGASTQCSRRAGATATAQVPPPPALPTAAPTAAACRAAAAPAASWGRWLAQARGLLLPGCDSSPAGSRASMDVGWR